MSKDQFNAMERCRRAQESGRTAKYERLFETNEHIKASTFEIDA